MSNFKQDIISEVGEDIIESVYIHKFESYHLEVQKRLIPGNAQAGKNISYETALPLLDYKYDSGFGSMDCHNIIMWSKNWVYYIHEYDGSTSIQRLKRNPQFLE